MSNTVTSTSLKTRVAAYADAAAILTFDEVARRDRTRVNFVHQAISDRCCHVAAEGGQAVAYGVLNNRFFGRGFVEMLYVAAGHRRRGVGSALLRHMEHACRDTRLFTSTDQSNRAMQALLAKLGYEPSGHIDNLDDNGRELIFVKSLWQPPPRRLTARG